MKLSSTISSCNFPLNQNIKKIQVVKTKSMNSLENMRTVDKYLQLNLVHFFYSYQISRRRHMEKNKIDRQY